MYTEFTIDNWDGHPGFQLGIVLRDEGLQVLSIEGCECRSDHEEDQSKFHLGNLEFSLVGRSSCKGRRKRLPLRRHREKKAKGDVNQMLHTVLCKREIQEPVMILKWLYIV